MRYLILICLFISSYSFAQVPYTFHTIDSLAMVRFNWKPAAAKNKRELTRFLNYIYTDSLNGENYFCGTISRELMDSVGFDDFSTYHSPNIHLIDIDADKDLDVIYDGRSCGGYETGDTYLFINSGDAYSHQLETNGTIVAIEHPSKKSTILTVYRYPCCTEFRHFLMRFQVRKEGSETVVTQLPAIGFVSTSPGDLKSPKQLNYPQVKAFKVIHPGSYLLLDPKRYSMPVNGITMDEDGFSPVVAVYEKGAEGIVTTEYTDEFNNRWYYVLFETGQPAQHYVFEQNIAAKEINYVAGWMLAEDVSVYQPLSSDELR